jgi:flagellar biosynthesis/type III secretory pathway M-ring protein FliF/YscJ
MATLNEQSTSRFLTLPRVLIVVTVCFLALLAVARPVLSRSSQSASQPAAVVSAQVEPATTASQSASKSPTPSMMHKAAKPRAGKPKMVKDI